MTLALVEPVTSAPRAAWSPGREFVELQTATAWARCLGPDRYEVVVLTSAAADDDGTPAFAVGVLSEAMLLTANWWLTHPSELRRLIDAQLLRLDEVDAEHPVLDYAEACGAELRQGTRPGWWADLGFTSGDLLAAEAEADLHAAELEVDGFLPVGPVTTPF